MNLNNFSFVSEPHEDGVKDNRFLTDTTLNQKLSSDTIRTMRKEGIHGEVGRLSHCAILTMPICSLKVISYFINCYCYISGNC